MTRPRSDADVFHAIADPTRRRMLELLRDADIPATQIARSFPRVSQPAVSQHLRVLRDAGLVRSKRTGRQHVYRIRPRQLRQVVDWIAHFDKFWDEKLEALGDYLNRQSPDAHAGRKGSAGAEATTRDPQEPSQ